MAGPGEKIEVLDHGYVKYIDSYGSDESIIEAARMSTNKGFKSWDTDLPLLQYLWKNKHLTPFEMAGMTIEVQAPIFVFREWQRHRTQSYNEMSARYVPVPDVNYMPSIERCMRPPGQSKQTHLFVSVELDTGCASEWLELLSAAYDRCEEVYRMGLDAGVPKELARCIMPVGRYSRMRAHASLRNWLQFLDLRLPDNAQWEIRQYAAVVQTLLQERFPRTMKLYGDGK